MPINYPSALHGWPSAGTPTGYGLSDRKKKRRAMRARARAAAARARARARAAVPAAAEEQNLYRQLLNLEDRLRKEQYDALEDDDKIRIEGWCNQLVPCAQSVQPAEPLGSIPIAQVATFDTGGGRRKRRRKKRTKKKSRKKKRKTLKKKRKRRRKTRR